MKTIVVFALAGCLAFVGCAGSETGTNADAEILSASHRVEANVSGMDCGGCTSSVCAAVEQVAGVTGATADLATGKVTVALKEDADADAAKAEIEQVIAGLSDGKFTIDGIEAITPEGQDSSEDNNADTAPETGGDA